MVNKRKSIGTKKNADTIKPVLEALGQIRDNEFVKGSELFYDDFNRIMERLQDDSFRLAVVGEFSSGKSTFLNALIGKDLLKHGAQETTATVTEIHNEETESNQTMLDVYFMNGTVEQNITADNITEYTATASKTYSVVQEIDKVVIKSKVLEGNEKVCFIDTPGLNGTADQHKEKTIEQIKNAHACIYLMQVRGLGQSDIDFLKYIIKYQRNIIFVQNFIDELKRMEGETPEQKVAEQKKIIDERITGRDDSLHYSIVAVSARKALISRANEFEKYNDEVLTENLREQLYKESRFDDVFSVINSLMAENEREKIRQRDAVAVALDLIRQLKTVVTFENEKEINGWEHSVEGKNNQNYKRLLQILKENKENYFKKLDNFIEAETSEIRGEAKNELEEGLREIEEETKAYIGGFREIKELEEYVDGAMAGELYRKVMDRKEKTERRINIHFENMVNDAVLRIKQYTGVAAAEKDIAGFEAKIEETGVKNFTKEEDEITGLRKELEKKRRENEAKQRDVDKKKKETIRIDREIEEKSRLVAEENSKKRAEIGRLCAMPEKETKYRKETYQEYRGGLGILDALFGPKTKTRQVPYTDDSNQQYWKKQKSDIETKYKEKIDKINALCRRLESERGQYTEEIEHFERTKKAREKELQSAERHLAVKIEYLNEQKEKAKQEYLLNAKTQILKNVHGYLFETVKDVLEDNYRQSVEKNKEGAAKVIRSLFELSYKKRIASLEGLIADTGKAKGISDTEDLLQTIQSTTEKLEGFLCQQQ